MRAIAYPAGTCRYWVLLYCLSILSSKSHQARSCFYRISWADPCVSSESRGRDRKQIRDPESLWTDNSSHIALLVSYAIFCVKSFTHMAASHYELRLNFSPGASDHFALLRPGISKDPTEFTSAQRLVLPFTYGQVRLCSLEHHPRRVESIRSTNLLSH